MIISALGFLFLLIVLFFLSRLASKNLYLLFFFLTHNQKTSVEILTWVLIPGTVIHELSHLLTASLLRVPTDGLTFTPKIRENNEVRAGGLKMAKTGPLRHFLIGLSPLLVGLSLNFSACHFLLFPLWQKTLSLKFSLANYQPLIVNCLLLIVISYLIFILSSTMFSSKKDLETVLFPLLLFTLFGFALWQIGIQISFSPKLLQNMEKAFQFFNSALLTTAVINLVFLIFIRFFNGLLVRIVKPIKK